MHADISVLALQKFQAKHVCVPYVPDLNLQTYQSRQFVCLRSTFFIFLYL